SRGHDLLRDFGIDPSTALLIGDTDHDAEVAEKLGTAAALVACGHQSEERLRAAGPHVFSTVRALGEAT
ncbi:HAD family hydrolase, partial [Candidatus Bipolaricaulota bacterium]|nr:HAD family hydrolase [Candidatus Bipolaricaulota bacterium]